jgi:outer membrane receptor protein involved in Fe transport
VLASWAAAQNPAPEPVKTSITVNEKISTEAPANITVVGKPELQQVPGVNLDDRLRSVPGFSLFRRSSSLVANPTTQGVSLRGIGSSGASRTLVLWDTIPLNDPFGGWVYWTRVAPEDLEQVEISRGASTSVFGDRALGGAINLFSPTPQPRQWRASYEGGSQNTHELAGGASHWLARRLGTRQIGGSANVRFFTTDGFFIVPARFRGAVDRKANVQFAAGTARFDVLGDKDRFFVRLNVLAEDRANGTVLQNNSTSLGTLSANYSRQFSRDALSVLAYHTRAEFRASFTALAANRQTERLTSIQQVPSEATGAAAFWSRSHAAWNVLAGADTERVEGTSTDRLVPTGFRTGGGSRLQHGVFGQGNVNWRGLKLFGGLRQQVTGTGRNFVNPSGGLAYGRGPWRVRGSLYRSLRVPTLNELFREFRAGNTATLANPALEPESLFGAEIGLDYVGERRRLSITGYRNDLDKLITNVTLSVTPTQITRQRRNAAQALGRGVEIQARQSWNRWTLDGAYLFADSRLVTGERLAQIPKHQGNAQLTYQRGGTFASLGFRAYSLQFEDDRNTLVLPGFATMQLAVRQRLVKSLSFTFALENAFDREFLVGQGVVPNIGAPRLVRAGLRWQ